MEKLQFSETMIDKLKETAKKLKSEEEVLKLPRPFSRFSVSLKKMPNKTLLGYLNDEKQRTVYIYHG